MVGLFGAFLSVITFFPQVYRTWKLKSAKELSLTMILIILLSNVTCLFYAFNKQDIAVISANFLSEVVPLLFYILRSNTNEKLLNPFIFIFDIIL